MIITDMQEPAIVRLTEEEATFKVNPFKSLIDRLALELEEGKQVIQMIFPPMFGCLYAAQWCDFQEFSSPEGKDSFKPIDVVHQDLINRGYKVAYNFNSESPDTIEIRKVG